jgi:hypothetical protein
VKAAYPHDAGFQEWYYRGISTQHWLYTKPIDCLNPRHFIFSLNVFKILKNMRIRIFSDL